MRWFEKITNRGGQAAIRFGNDSRNVNGLLTTLISTVIMNFSTILIGIIFALYFEWRLGLIGFIAMPAMVTSGFISMFFFGGFAD